ncbi:hypothetical protein LAC81_13605 [Ensifer adhaerens]|uniref:hypothetical protein n=1 Tax=Ensifer adhaerens TaxID=106592 RepID=UPI001CBC23B6|nr:hypothetical protein [Ensifer adhaerens]MBZ7922827.1 hypothetical protein [Ensifer adhaerens]UAX91430.1 hypothetical protein LAC78_13600 [Ensifer adhaerens]UAX99058.1 hypothetical protein LAC80_13605 [Ensifer adhaerens]UAY06441.1 hypothetical protein LAC81_13605 [Ensifer adhaerens]
MSTLDLCIVATRRPDLLAQTLTSFRERIFSNLELGGAYLNLDPAFGSIEDHHACVDIFRSYFPEGVVFQPESPGFCAAVARLWSATSAEYVFHLEDDWIALRDMGTELLAPFADPAITQVSFHTADQNWDIGRKGHFHQRNEYARFLGIKIPLFRTFPKFTTSPSILRGGFARHCAGLMDLSRDPEKQFYSGVNPAMESYVRRSRNYIFSPEAGPVIKDMGREWREQRRIQKVITNSTSIWRQSA